MASKIPLHICVACRQKLPLDAFRRIHRPVICPRTWPQEGLAERCTVCVAAAAREVSNRRGAAARSGRRGAVAAAAAREAVVLEASTGVPHAVDHIVPLVSPRVQSLNGPDRPGRFVGPLLPLVQGLHVPANLQAMPAADNSAKSNRWWPDMPDHPTLLAAKVRYDAIIRNRKIRKARPCNPFTS